MAFSLASLKNQFDEVRAQFYPKNETEKKVYDALSSKNWGASTTQMNEIAADTNNYEKYRIITEIIWNNLETDGRSWKQIFKTLSLIDFLIKNGSERFIEDSRDKLHKIRSLQDYNYYEGTIDKGNGVREKSKQIVDLLSNNDSIRQERDKARQLRNKFIGIESQGSVTSGGYGGYSGGDSHSSDNYNRNTDNYRGNSSYSDNNKFDDYNSGGRRSSAYDSSNSNNLGRYGGGAYDSNRPPRYGDDVQVEDNKKKSYYDEPEEEEVKPARRASSSTVNSTNPSAGKLKINIKKNSVSSAPAIQETNLFDTGDLIGEPINTTSSNFDPFGVTPAPAQNPPVTSFDPFGPSHAPVASAPVAAPAFDPFSTHVSHSAPVHTTPAFDPFAQNQQSAAIFAPPPVPVVPAFDPFATAPPAPVPNQMTTMPLNTMSAPHPGYGHFHQQTIPVVAHHSTISAPYKPQIHSTQSHDADFGDFETAPSASFTAPIKTTEQKWGDLGSLVDLSKIEKNEDASAKKSAAANAAQSQANHSFAGLDGFSKAQQSMGSNMAPRPLGSYSMAPPTSSMAPPMRSPAPMGAMPPMGGMTPMGAPMGGPMGGMNYGAPMGAAPGYPQAGSYPNAYPNAYPGMPPQGYGMYQNQPPMGYPPRGF